MISKALNEHLESVLGEKIISVNPLSGGDINEVYRLGTASEDYVVKLNKSNLLPELFRYEKQGLEAIEATKSLKTPRPIATGDFDGSSFLLLSYIEPGNANRSTWENFGSLLAQMHRNTFDEFGFFSDNYIGSLPQQNAGCSSAVEFHISQRLEPQIKLAGKKGYLFKDTGVFYRELENQIPEESPALIHGDLWSGNYLIDKNGEPCLIDPAVSYSHREADIAMMRLFGGFSQQVFDTYHEHYNLEKGWQERSDIWQLYYLLVHLNLFGTSYLPAVSAIIKKYAS